MAEDWDIMQPEAESFSLKEKIQHWNKAFASEFPEEVQQIFAAKTQEIIRSGILSKCLTTGDAAPDFSIANARGEEVSLNKKLKNGPAILSFYRGTWCPYCNLEFRELLDQLPKFRSRDAVVLALSPQVLNRNEVPTEQGFEDLSDRGNAVARNYGLVYPLGEEIKRIYESFGIRIDEINADESFELPLPATFIVDRDAQIRYAFTSGDIGERAEPGELVEVLAGM